MEGTTNTSQRRASLWTKTPLAFVWGLLISISLLLNIFYLSPFRQDVNLFIGVISGFSFWAIAMTYYLSHTTNWQATKPCALLLAISAAVNLVLSHL